MRKLSFGTRLFGIAGALACICLAVLLASCGSSSQASSASAGSSSGPGSSASASAASIDAVESSAGDVPTKESLIIGETIVNDADGDHAIEVDGAAESYENVEVRKTGEADGDEADFYGENAAVFATNGAALNLSGILVESGGKHANGVFSYGEGTTVNIVDSVIETQGNCSGGLMTTGGAALNAQNLRITTTGNSSAAIRSDRGGGTVNVGRGIYTTSGTGSPVIYSTADITVSDAELESTASQGVVVEGKNSVTLNDSNLVADNNTKNSDKSAYYQAVMIYQSMSGDAADGESSFAMHGGTLTNKNGDVFFVNNTVANIDLNGATIVNEDAGGVFLRAAAAGWGSEGSNGGQVTLNAASQQINGDMIVDDVSNLNLYLGDASAFSGAINASGQAGDVYVCLTGGSTWTLTGDAYISSLTCDADSIELNGHVLYVDGQAYEAGTASTGEPVETVVSASPGGSGEAHGEAPDGEGDGEGKGAHGAEKPSGSSAPPSKPSSKK